MKRGILPGLSYGYIVVAPGTRTVASIRRRGSPIVMLCRVVRFRLTSDDGVGHLVHLRGGGMAFTMISAATMTMRPDDHFQDERSENW